MPIPQLCSCHKDFRLIVTASNNMGLLIDYLAEYYHGEGKEKAGSASAALSSVCEGGSCPIFKQAKVVKTSHAAGELSRSVTLTATLPFVLGTQSPGIPGTLSARSQASHTSGDWCQSRLVAAGGLPLSELRWVNLDSEKHWENLQMHVNGQIKGTLDSRSRVEALVAHRGLAQWLIIMAQEVQ